MVRSPGLVPGNCECNASRPTRFPQAVTTCRFDTPPKPPPLHPHDPIRLPAAHADRIWARQGRVVGRPGRRTGSAAGPGGERSGHRGGRPHGAGPGLAGRGRHRSAPVRGRGRESLDRQRRGRRCFLPAPRSRADRRLRRRQLDGLRQRHQLPLHQRRADAGLLGRGQSHSSHAADDRRADHRRHGQRDPIVRADLRRQDARQDGLRRQEGVVPRGAARSRS